MRAIIQRVKEAEVVVDSKSVAKISQGLLVLVAFGDEDQALLSEPTKLKRFAQRVINLRIFEDKLGKMNLSVQDIGGQVLLVSEFTLYAELESGHRPSFSKSLNKADARVLYQALLTEFQALPVPVASGIFGAKMLVRLVNDGPVTIILGGHDAL